MGRIRSRTLRWKSNWPRIALGLAFVASGAWADSDGYFCTSTGYVAYELREWSAPEKRHVLKIVRLGHGESVFETHTVPLEDFQLHGLKCAPGSVQLVSWDKTFRVALPASGAARIESVTPHAAGVIPPEVATESFNLARQSRSIPVASAAQDWRYELQIVYRAWKNEHRTTGKLVARSADGRRVRELVLHDAVRKEATD